MDIRFALRGLPFFDLSKKSRNFVIIRDVEEFAISVLIIFNIDEAN